MFNILEALSSFIGTEPEVSVLKKQDAVNININISVRNYIGDIDTLVSSVTSLFRKDNHVKRRKPPEWISLPGRVRKRRVGPTNSSG